MALSQTEHGKAFEYACLVSLSDEISKVSDFVRIIESDALSTAQKCYLKARNEGCSESLVQAASAAARAIVKLEPQLEYGTGEVSLCIQTDAQGAAGDVRDVVCIRDATGWEIGLSCKHNHHAVKHCRLSDKIDFGEKWLGFSCSQEYFKEINRIFTCEDRDVNWCDIEDKEDRYYIPVLNCFMKQLKRIMELSPDAPKRFVQYMVGKYDFYKVISDERHRITKIEAMNLNGSLNASVDNHKSYVSVPKLKLPEKLYHVGFIKDSETTIEVVFDGGWAFTMRIHNAQKKVVPSLKFDVQRSSTPSTVHSQIQEW